MVDLTPFLNDWAYPLLAVLLAGLAAWILVRSQAWLAAHASFLDVQTRQKIVTLEQQAIAAGVDYIISTAHRAGDNAKISISSPITRYGVQIAVNHAGGLLKDNGADPDEIAAKILAQLPDNIVATDTTGATVTTTTITVQNLPPIGNTK